MKKLFLLIITAIVLISGCAQPQAPPVKTVPEQTTGPSSSSGIPMPTTITIKNFAFQPAEIAIKQGTNVTWKNEDNVAHTVTAKDFDSGPIQPGNQFSHEFDIVGTYEYACSIHPSMKGKITVT